MSGLGDHRRWKKASLAAVAAVALLLAGCDGSPPAPRPPSPAKSVAPKPGATVKVVSRLPGAKRLVAIGDLHGDLRATRAALRLGGLVDEADRWVGGDTVLVQCGDILDRGNQERAIVDLLERLRGEARGAGGAVHILNGNHELMNVVGDLRYVSPQGLSEFSEFGASLRGVPAAGQVPAAKLGRFAAFRPGGRYARTLADHPIVLVVGDTVFAHGGVLPKHVRHGIERINQEAAAWLLGHAAAGVWLVKTEDSPVWLRHFGDEPDEADCRLLGETLAALKVARMVVGHTTKETITPACDRRVWAIDVGMAAYAGGEPEVLEITPSGARAIR